MAKPVVSIVRCDEYDLDRIEDAVRRGIDLIGGMASFVEPGQRVLLKPNLVRSMTPDRAATTHPTVVAAVAKMVIEAGARPVIVESPGGPYSTLLLRNTYRRTEMNWVAEATGAELNLDVTSTQVPHPEGVVLHRLDVVQPLLDADVVINLPKLKTHNLTGLTLAVKNLFGLVPGAVKISYHSKMQDHERFYQGMVDILTYVRPALDLMDAVIAMEGQGPSGGEPRQIGAIVASADALALDTVCAAMVGFGPREVGTTSVAADRGLTSGRVEDLELVGEPLASLRVADFRRGIQASVDPGLVPRALRWLLGVSEAASDGYDEDTTERSAMHALSHSWLWRQLVATPRAGPKCTACGFCVEHCPVDAIEIIDGRAHMDARMCIRCYCCHELCPALAVELFRPLLGRLMYGK